MVKSMKISVNLERAKQILKTDDNTCVFCDGDKIITGKKRGVLPLLEQLDNGPSIRGFSAADKVVGKGAAFLYVLLEVKELYAEVISQSAYEVLKDNGIAVFYGELVEGIRNRDNTGNCPIETAVAHITEPEEALPVIRTKWLSLKLFSMQDAAYRDFHSRLMPTVEKERVIGIRTPLLRKFAKEFSRSGGKELFMSQLPHHYYEENNLHGFLIEEIKDYNACVAALEQFLPYVDNWATCDMMSPKALKKNKADLESLAVKWMDSEEEFKVRFGIGIFMKYFLDEDFREAQLLMIAKVSREEYYIKMMVAWYFATALAKQYEATIPYLENRVLSPWVHAKTIQKAVESYRITKEQKKYLRSLK